MFLLYSGIFGILLFIFLFLYYFCTRNYNYWKTRNIIGPKPVFLFGNLKDYSLRKENIAVTLQKCYNNYPNQPVIGIYRMISPSLLLRDLDIIKNVMIKDFDVFEDRGVEFSIDGLGKNLFHADGNTWKALRHKFTPLFTTSKLKGMFHLIVGEGNKFVTFLHQSTVHQPEHEIYSSLKWYTTSSILACAFDLNMGKVNKATIKTLEKIDNLILSVNFYHDLDMMFPGIFKNFSSSIFPTEITRFFEELTANIIENRKGKPSNRNDLMDLIIEMKQQGDITANRENQSYNNLTITLTSGIIAAQAFSFYVGGYETSASTLSLMMYELALQPDIQDKVIEEIDDALRKHNGNITYESIRNIPYIEKVIHETLRKYPIVPLQRKAKKDYKIPETEITIEKNTVVVVSALGIHYDEKYYPNSKKFDPERFNPENSKNRHPCAYLPFGVGPRHCIGVRFAKIQIRVLVMQFFSKFRVEPSSRTTKIVIDPKRQFVNPLNGVYLKLIPRTTN